MPYSSSSFFLPLWSLSKVEMWEDWGGGRFGGIEVYVNLKINNYSY